MGYAQCTSILLVQKASVVILLRLLASCLLSAVYRQGSARYFRA